MRSRPIKIPWSVEGEETTKGKLKAIEVVSRVRTRRTSSRPWGRTLWKALSCSWCSTRLAASIEARVASTRRVTSSRLARLGARRVT